MPAGINSRLDTGEEKTGDLEDTVRQFTQNENGTNNFFLMKKIISFLKDSIQWPNTCVTGVSEGKRVSKYI